MNRPYGVYGEGAEIEPVTGCERVFIIMKSSEKMKKTRSFYIEAG